MSTFCKKWVFAAAFLMSASALYCTAMETADSIVCHIEGTVVNRPDSRYAYLLESGSDIRVTGALELPIVDGKFSYDLKTDMARRYEIIFDDEWKQGGWFTKSFFVGDGDVELTYYDDEHQHSNNVVSQLPDNIMSNRWEKMNEELNGRRRKELEDSVDALFEQKLAYVAPLRLLLVQYETAKKGTEEKDSLSHELQNFFKKEDSLKYSPEYLALKAQQTELWRQSDSLMCDFISREPSLFGLSTIKRILQNHPSQSKKLRFTKVFNTVYRDSMAYHPYTAEIIMAIDADAVKKGNRYPDFTISRPDGSTEQISNLIKGKIAVINLWASWCGPCRRHSIELIPVYEKYHDKNFVLVAIARESNNGNAMNKAILADGYPWESFVDIDDKDNVWKINGAGNAGGRIILVDSCGIIVDSDASPASIAAYLKENLDKEI